jgi:hypothetical protein
MIYPWFSLTGQLIHHIYKWLLQDSLHNLIPDSLLKKFKTDPSTPANPTYKNLDNFIP